MTMRIAAMILGAFVATATHAQELLPVQAQKAQPPLQGTAPDQPDPFAGIGQPAPRLYGADAAAQPGDHLLKGFRRAPQPVLGVKVAPGVALEASHVSLPYRGLYRVDPLEQNRAEGASQELGQHGSSNHVAAKVSLPEDARLSAYAKAGIAYSEKKRGLDAGSDTGLYTGAGAKYKVGKSTTLNGEFTRHDDAATRFRRFSNDGVKANMTMGF